MEITFKIEKPVNSSSLPGKITVDFLRADFEILSEALDAIDWERVFDTSDLDLMVDRFYKVPQ
jgi:hypothetical protein